jgi:hypothetical protein
LQMVEEADDRSAALELGFQFRNDGKRLGAGIVQIEDDE